MFDLNIIGAGPAGLTAAIYGARAGLSVNVCEEKIYGGQCTMIEKLENYPGFKSISGAEFSNNLYEQTENFGVEFSFGKVVKVDLEDKKKSVTLEDGSVLDSKTVVISGGLKRRNLGCPGEKELIGKGVSYCATCDGMFFKSKKVIVVGGGNTALQDALYLSNVCSEVTIVVRKPKFRGEKFLVDAVEKKDNIKIEFESVVKEIKGENCVTGVDIERKGMETQHLDADGIFIAIGYEPDLEMYKNQIKTDDKGYFLADDNCETNFPGVYVAGDCRKKFLRQIVTATADGAVAGSRAAEYVLSAES